MLPILKCGQMEHARTARTGLTLAKLVLSVTLTGTTLSDNHRAGLSVEVWHSHWQSHVSTGVVALFRSPHASAGLHPVVVQPTRECRFATSLSCSPHASAGLHQRCLASRTLQPRHLAAYTQVQVCNLVGMQPTRECGFASMLSCSPHTCAGLQPCCHAAHTHARVCICIVLQPTRECRFATSLSCSPHASAGLHQRCLASRTLQPHHLAAYTQVQVCNLVVMQPTRECGFASTLPCISYIATTPSCSPHVSAGLQPRCHAAHMQVRVCIHVALQLVHCNHTILQLTRKCRFATSLSCSPHASAGLHPRCFAAHTHVQVRSHVVMQPTRTRGFAFASSCSLHASAGLQPRCHAAHTRVRVCIHVV